MSKPNNKFTSGVYRLLLLLTVALIAFSPAMAGKATKKEDHDVANSFPYLYASRKNFNASFPVIEHFAPSGKKNLVSDKPDFLYKEDQGYRIVVFYGHWCNTCKNLKPHFVHFAQRVQQLAAHQNETVSIHAVSCHPNRKLCRKQTTQGYPLIRLLKPGATEGIDMKHTDINPVKCLEKLGIHLDTKEDDENWDVSVPIENSRFSQLQRMLESVIGKPTDSIPYHRRTREELKADIHLSFDFAMRDGVFSSDEPLTDKASKALKDWLKLLSRTLPAAWDIHKLLDQLLRDFNYISKHEAYLYSVLDQFPPESSTWSPACSHGDPDAGYTCGLWELFHAMTVGVVDYNIMNPEKRRIATEDAAHTLRDYIEHFFGCIECRNNFLAAYDNCANDRCNRLSADTKGLVKDKQNAWAQLPLWLFETHNSVNVRLMKEQAGRDDRATTLQDEIDVLWPPKRDCFPCWKTISKNNEVRWDQTNVFKWLLLEYGQRDANAENLKKELHALTAAMKKKERTQKRRIEITNGSALMAFCVMAVLGAKVRRRRVTGRHKKDDGGDASLSSPLQRQRDESLSSPVQRQRDESVWSPLRRQKRGTLTKVGMNEIGLRTY